MNKKISKLINPQREAIKLMKKNLPQLKYQNKFVEVEKIPTISKYCTIIY